VALQVHCVNKLDRYNPHERILNIGGFNSDGTRWKLSQRQAIDGIKEGKWAFYVSRGGATIDVVIAVHMGNEYLKTRPDHTGADNLLSLPECPP